MVPRLSKRTGVIGAVAAVLLIVGASWAMRAPDRSQDTSKAVPPEPPILHEGEVLELADDGMTFLATDTATRDQRTVARCVECAYVTRFAPSADGRWIAYEAVVCGPYTCDPVEPGAGVWVVGVTGPIHVTTDGSYTSAWSPTTDRLAFVVGGSGGGSELFQFDPATGERTSIVKSEGEIPTLAWSPDGSTIAYVANDHSQPSRLFLVRPGSHPERIRGSSIDPPCCSLDARNGIDNLKWSPDGTRLAVSSYGYGVRVMRIDGSEERTVLDRQPRHFAWSPDGLRIAYIEGHDVRIVSASGGAPAILVDADRNLFGGVAWSPDGRFVAFRPGGYAWTRHWFVAPAYGSNSFEEIDRLEVERWLQG